MTIKLLQRVLKLMCCLAALALAGCVSTLNPQDTLKSDEGAFVFKVISDAARGDSLLYQIEAIEMQSEDGPNEPIFLAGTGQREATTPEAMIFSGRLKPGRYRLVRGHNLSGAGAFAVSVGLGYFGSFVVRAGEVTHLGALILHPVGELAISRGNNSTDLAYGYVPPDAEALRSFEQYFPALALQVKTRASNGFILTPKMNALAESALNYKKSSRYVNSIWQDERGNFFAGKSMGKVLLKQAGHTGWREVDVGSWRGVHSVKPYGAGLIAGGEEGLLKFSSDDGNSWVDLVPPSWGHVAHVEVVHGKRVVVVLRRGDTWTAFVSDDALLGKWNALNTLPIDRAVPVYPPFSPLFVRRGNTLVIGGGGLSKLYFLELDSGRFESVENPVPLVHLISVQPNGNLVMRASVLKYVAMLSEDGGKTWRELKSRGLVAFKDSSNAYSVYDRHVAYSRNGGDKWVNHDNASWKAGEVREFQIDRADQSLVVFLYDGSIHRSRDEGATWQKER